MCGEMGDVSVPMQMIVFAFPSSLIQSWMPALLLRSRAMQKNIYRPT
jgi:hypothetical protein